MVIVTNEGFSSSFNADLFFSLTITYMARSCEISQRIEGCKFLKLHDVREECVHIRSRESIIFHIYAPGNYMYKNSVFGMYQWHSTWSIYAISDPQTNNCSYVCTMCQRKIFTAYIRGGYMWQTKSHTRYPVKCCSRSKSAKKHHQKLFLTSEVQRRRPSRVSNSLWTSSQKTANLFLIRVLDVFDSAFVHFGRLVLVLFWTWWRIGDRYISEASLWSYDRNESS